ncbi:MAG: hypothetical protein ACLFWG_07545, partial [Longimicrobiales bacterium]
MVFGASLLLAWRLRRSRVGGAILAILLLFLLPSVGTRAPTPVVVGLLMAVGAPVTWIVLALPRDRPLLSRRGIFGPILGVTVPAATVWAALRWPDAVEDFLFFSYPVPVLPWTPSVTTV